MRGVLRQAAEYLADERKVVLAVLDFPTDGSAAVKGAQLPAAEVKDLNRSRAYLRDVARRHGVDCHSSVADAVQETVEVVHGLGL